MNYAAIKMADIANGPGVRVSLFVSGCRRHCKNCFNSETWDFNYGDKFDIDTENKIFEGLDKSYIEGFSLLGGEPFEKENRETVRNLLRKVRARYPNKTIWCYSGFKFEELIKDAADILENIDVLVDGEFIDEKKNLKLKFRGSENQRIVDVKKSMESGKVVEIDM
ncbi:MAG: anaerobic ribonucleoside-triphosphate reductase activating protein [Oscillospiraceae bacterium]|nr:anaerobic ribonucleoside-triphosphate reductase activating protein [Oscillospiraceae bacterium]